MTFASPLGWQSAIVVKRWLHRDDADASGLTFTDWQPTEGELDPNEQRAFLIVNSSELRGVATLGRAGDARAEISEIVPPALEAAARIGGMRRTRGAAMREVVREEGVLQQFRLRVDTDNTWRERCE